MTPPTDSLTLGLMAKHWQSGDVKTRLGRVIGMELAADLHRLFVTHLCRSLNSVANRRVVCVAPDQRVETVRSELVSLGLPQPWDVEPQGGGDLGQRMKRWFARTLQTVTLENETDEAPRDGAANGRAILIGADCPTLDAGTILQAHAMLQTHDAVVGPAVDGGYYLIGLRGTWHAHQTAFESLFEDVPWSTDRVLPVTRSRAKSSELSLGELGVREDIDTVVELTRLRESIREDDAQVDLSTAIDRILGDFSLANLPASDD